MGDFCGGDGESAFSMTVMIGDQARTGPSLCFLDVIIGPVEAVVLFVLVASRLATVAHLPSTGVSIMSATTVADKVQLILVCLLAILPLISMLIIPGDVESGAQVLYHVMQFLEWISITACAVLETLRGQRRSAGIKLFWMAHAFALMLRFRIAILHVTFSEKPEAGSKATAYAVMHDDVGDAGEKSKDSVRPRSGGEADASWWGYVTFGWLSPLLVLGKDTQLAATDLPPILKGDTSEDTGKTLLEAWKRQLKARPDDPSLFRAVMDVYLKMFVQSGAWKFINDMVVFIGPLLLQSLIAFVEQGGQPGAEERSVVDGALLAVGIFVAKTVESFALAMYFHMGYRIGGRLRNAAAMIVYRKSFLLSSKGRQTYKVGEMVSLMSVDATRLCNSAPYLHLFWSTPLQLSVGTTLLYNLLGPSVFADCPFRMHSTIRAASDATVFRAGLATMIVMIPLNTWIAKKQAELNRAIMKIKDERSNVMDEVLQGIRIIKYFAWERSFKKKVSEVREREVSLIWKNALWGVASMFLWGGSPMLVALITFIVYSASGNDLKPSIAFTGLALFNVLRFPLNTLPMIINLIVESQVALGRIRDYLLADEIDRSYYENRDDAANDEDGISMSRGPKAGDLAIAIQEGRFSWAQPRDEQAVERQKQREAEEKKRWAIVRLFSRAETSKLLLEKEMAGYNVVLRDIDLGVKQGELAMVVGKVGCGKSSLLAAVLGEMKKEAGVVCLAGSVAYAAQQPWIVNATVKENILFGRELDVERYEQVLHVCALTQDLDVLPAGDETEIGEKGINLSGGQKARISLARAVYQDADVYLLDDPLSAVDVHVAKHLMEECIEGYLARKTRVLVTHQIQFLPRADHVVMIDGARIAADGPYQQVAAEQPHLVHGDSKDKSEEDGADSKGKDKSPAGGDSPLASLRAAGAPKKVTGPSASTLNGGKTTTKEARKEGKVSLGVWKGYIASVGVSISLLIVLAYVVSQSLQILSDGWLSQWSTASVEYRAQLDEAAQTGEEEPTPFNETFYTGMYALITLFAAGSIAARSAVVATGVIRSACLHHDKMLACVLRAPTKFFDTTPTGRVLNRFTSDQYTLDNELRQTVAMVLMCTVRVLSVGAVIFYVTPILVPLVIPLGYIYYRVQEFYRQSSRELKRIDAVSKSPIYAQFSETLNGVSTIRAFNSQLRFMGKNFQLNDAYSTAYFANNAANRWLGIRLELIGNIAVGTSALFAVLQNGNDPSTAGIVGLSVTYALDVTGTLNWAVRTFTQLESYMVSCERVREYSQMETEAPAIVESARPHASWPSEGRVKFDNVQLRYREELEPALKGVSFETKAGEKVGIVGRTGAGKSTLAVALFRITEIFRGSILVDGTDVSQIGLDDLRTKLSIIPQDPVLFAGTVRSNLDPFEDYSDAEINETLSKVHMKEWVDGTANGLLHEVQEGGSNLSVGQRQLLCMARALLRKAKVIIMDEATASVDMQTDNFIQETIREQFTGSTVLTIAHRLATVMACDRVMVMGEGKVLEMGPPKELMEDGDSIFHDMTADKAKAKEMLK